MRAIISIIYILCIVLNSDAAQSAHEGCPCLDTPQENANYDFEYAYPNVDPQGIRYPSTYGLSSCDTHDANLAPFCESNAESFCLSKFCYIDPDNCDVNYSPSSFFPGSYYSYNTCGDLDTWHSFEIKTFLQGKHLRVAVLNNSAGWLGSYHHDDTPYDSDESHYGPAFEFFKTIQSQAGFTFEYVTVSSETLEGHVSSFTATVQDISMGYIDIAVASFTQTEERAAMSTFTPMMEPQLMYIATVKETSGPTTDLFLRPFGAYVWITIFLFVFAAFVASGVIEFVSPRIPDPDDPVPEQNRISIIKHIVTLDRETTRLKSESLLILRVVAFLVMFLLSIYTANLTSIMSKTGPLPINSIDDVMKHKGKICTIHAYASSLVSKFDFPQRRIVKFQSRDEIPEGLKRGDCLAAYVESEDFQMYHSAGSYCNMQTNNEPVQILNTGFPVSNTYAESFSYWVTKLKVGSLYDQIRKEYEPQNACAVVQESDQLMFEQVQFPFIAAYVAVILLLLKSLCSSLRSSGNDTADPVAPIQASIEEHIVPIGESAPSKAKIPTLGKLLPEEKKYNEAVEKEPSELELKPVADKESTLELEDKRVAAEESNLDVFIPDWAGRAEDVSGRYVRYGDFKGKPRYKKGEYEIWWNGRWFITLRCCSGSTTGSYYYNSSYTPTPPESGWVKKEYKCFSIINGFCNLVHTFS